MRADIQAHQIKLRMTPDIWKGPVRIHWQHQLLEATKPFVDTCREAVCESELRSLVNVTAHAIGRYSRNEEIGVKYRLSTHVS